MIQIRTCAAWQSSARFCWVRTAKGWGKLLRRRLGTAAGGPAAKSCMAKIAKLLEHKDPRLQALAARVLGSMGADGKEALPALERVNDDSDATVVVAVTEARMHIDGRVDRAVQRLDG